MNLNKKQLPLHVFSWLLITVYISIQGTIHGSWAALIIGRTVTILNYMFVFYSLSLFVFPKYWEGKRTMLSIGILSTLMLFWAIGRFNAIVLIPSLGAPSYYKTVSLFHFFKATFYYFLITASAGVASFFSRYGLYKLKTQTENEKWMLLKELNILKSQFNPQITFNFLNYCYQKTNKQLPETAESIKLFSNMLRYTLQTKPDEKVALNHEIIYIKDFISLQKLLSAKVYTNFQYTGDLNNKQILPRILITFVENAFKHGLGNDPENPIAINLIVKNDRLIFTVKNKINPNKATQSSNTGLENVNQILELYYTNNYELKTEETDGFFNVELGVGL